MNTLTKATEIEKLPHPDDYTMEEFRQLPLIVEGESKEIRALTDDHCLIYFKPTIYSFSKNRTGVVEGSSELRIKACEVLVNELKANGVDHTYEAFGQELVLSKTVRKPPNIETIVKATHTGTSKHRYYAMNQYRVRESHSLFAGIPFEKMNPYPRAIVRFDWRNPFWHPDTGEMLADEALSDEMADFFIDTEEARKTAHVAFHALQKFLAEKDIVIQDVCFFLTEDGKTMYGEISQDCGRFRHFDLGSLDKDVWRSGGSSEQVLEKWSLLYDMMVS